MIITTAAFSDICCLLCQTRIPFILQVNFLLRRWKKEEKRQTDEIWTVSLRQSSLTCFCSRARRWAAAAVCWHPESRAGLWGPSAVEPVGETKQETVTWAGFTSGWCHPLSYLIYLTGKGATKQSSHPPSIVPWSEHKQAHEPGLKWSPPVNPFVVLTIRRPEIPKALSSHQWQVFGRGTQMALCAINITYTQYLTAASAASLAA